uniref:FERM domain-containing protein n=1 Tax=Strongyloides venezuelensis TaxID=75913 RepID=A0A0K0FMX7_STRVS
MDNNEPTSPFAPSKILLVLYENSVLEVKGVKVKILATPEIEIFTAFISKAISEHTVHLMNFQKFQWYFKVCPISVSRKAKKITLEELKTYLRFCGKRLPLRRRWVEAERSSVVRTSTKKLT